MTLDAEGVITAATAAPSQKCNELEMRHAQYAAVNHGTCCSVTVSSARLSVFTGTCRR